MTRGGPLPGSGAAGPATAPRGSVILLSAEDDPATAIVPRLLAAGAVMERVKILTSIVEPGFDGNPYSPDTQIVACERMPTVHPQDLRVIERQAAELGDCRLIVFDPITAYLGGPDGQRGGDTRRVLAPLNDMARRLGAAIVLVTHHNKRGASSANGKYRVLGDIAFVGVCRANLLFLQDPDDPTGDRRLMLDNGRNQGPRQPALAFVIRDDGIGPFCDWSPETIDLDADAALARAVRAARSGASGKGARRRDCEEWLRGYLAAGPRSAKECEQAALGAGFNRSILERARGAGRALPSLGIWQGGDLPTVLTRHGRRGPNRPISAPMPMLRTCPRRVRREEHEGHEEHGETGRHIRRDDSAVGGAPSPDRTGMGIGGRSRLRQADRSGRGRTAPNASPAPMLRTCPRRVRRAEHEGHEEHGRPIGRAPPDCRTGIADQTATVDASDEVTVRFPVSPRAPNRGGRLPLKGPGVSGTSRASARRAIAPPAGRHARGGG